MISSMFTSSELMGTAGILLLTIILLRKSYRHLRRPKRKKMKATIASLKKQSTTTNSMDAPADVAQWEVHLHEVTRELYAQLDNKMIALSHLIRQAKEECDKLDAKTSLAQEVSDDAAANFQELSQIK